MGRFRAEALAAVLLLTAVSPVAAAEPAGALKPLAFLIGRWEGGGAVQDTGGAARGVSTFTVEAGGGAILRRDRTDTVDRDGKPTGGFEQIMLIYPENGGVRAEYSDGRHLIHYVSARIEAGAVEFVSADTPGAPVFHLRYAEKGADTLSVSFAMTAPGASTLQPIATGELRRAK